MPWHQIGEVARCTGRLYLGIYSGKPRSRRCETILQVGAWFYLHASKTYCEACAIDPKQEVNAAPRRIVDQVRVRSGAGRGQGHGHAVDARHQTDVDDH